MMTKRDKENLTRIVLYMQERHKQLVSDARHMVERLDDQSKLLNKLAEDLEKAR
jgi:flagellar biosynthesis regulator FlaF